MTNGVTAALAQPQGVKTKAERQSPQKETGEAFGHALNAAKPGRQVALARMSADADPHWLRTASHRDIPVTAGEPPRPKAQVKFMVSLDLEPKAEVEAEEQIEEKPREQAEAAEPREAAVAIFLPRIPPSLHHPAFASARVGAADAEAPQEDGGEPAAGAKPAVPAQPVQGEANAPPRVESVSAPKPVASASPQTEAAGEQAQPTAIRADGASARQASAKPPEAKTVPVRATVIAEQSFPAPPMSPTVGPLVERLSAEAVLLTGPAKAPPAMPVNPTAIGQAHALKLQLHPAELGMVTASLRFAGEQLSVELQVENSEAYNRLSADSEAIVKSLRGLGYEIDRVTILQPAAAPTAQVRAEADPGVGNQSARDAQSFGSEDSNAGGDRLGGRNSGERDHDSPQGGQGNAARTEDRAGGSLYI